MAQRGLTWRTISSKSMRQEKESPIDKKPVPRTGAYVAWGKGQ